MVKYKYLKAKFIELLTSDTSQVKLFLTEVDLKFLKQEHCLISVSTSDCLSGQYLLEVDRKQVLRLCNC